MNETDSTDKSMEAAESTSERAGGGEKTFDSIIIGAGPAGMAAAADLYEKGVDNILLLERNDSLGGILNQCIHTGFGLTYFREDLTGPEYARKLEKKVDELSLPCRLETMVTAVTPAEAESDLSGAGEGGLFVHISSVAGGREILRTRSVLVATGCRERTRENLLIPGTRPAGVYSAGQAQDLINIRGLHIGKRVVIQGSGDIGLIMARRLSIEGYEVVTVLERLPYLSGLVRNKVQCLDHFSIPLELNRQIRRIDGKSRVEGVLTERLDENFSPVPGGEEYVECDTVLFSVGLIPELETAKSAGVKLKNGFNPEVDDGFQTNIPGIFVCGNALHINDLADSASREGEKAARRIAEYLSSESTFRSRRKDRLPYREPEKDTSLTEDYFDRLKREGKLICIICPKGCEVTETEAGCEKGFDFYRTQKENPSQRMATTVWADREKSRRLPVVSESDVPVAKIHELRRALANLPPGSISPETRIDGKNGGGALFRSPEVL